MLKRCGDDLFSVITESPQDAQALASQLRDSGDWLEVIPGIDSVVLRFDAALYDGDDVRQTIEATNGVSWPTHAEAMTGLRQARQTVALGHGLQRVGLQRVAPGGVEARGRGFRDPEAKGLLGQLA